MTMFANSITIAFTGFSGTVIDVTPPSASRESLKTSHQGTKVASNEFHTFIPATFVDWGECELTVQYSPTLSTFGIISKALKNVVIEYPDGSSHDFDAYVTGFKPASGGLDTVMTASLTLKVTGGVTYTSA